MSLASVAAAQGQRLIASIMDDTCTITRAYPDPPFSKAAGTLLIPDPRTVYAGKCRIRARNPIADRDRDVQFGERAVYTWPYLVFVPVAVAVELNDLVVLTACLDPTLVGRQLRIRAVTRGTHLTAHRLACEEHS